jgi:hypothetical protein
MSDIVRKWCARGDGAAMKNCACAAVLFIARRDLVPELPVQREFFNRLRSRKQIATFFLSAP